MAAPVWNAGTLYAPGDLVQPITAPAPASAAISNAGFESGSTNWTLGVGVTIQSGTKFAGSNAAQFTGTAGNVFVLHDSVAVAPGTSITASCMYAQGAAPAGKNVGCVILRWLTAGDVFISDSVGSLVTSSSGGFKVSTVTGVAPATAAKVQIGARATRDNSNASFVDTFTWDYATVTSPAGLIFKAVQASPGFSGSTEPVWPASLGLTVVDNQVTWEAVATSRVTWTARPLLTSGATEPTWPTEVGEFIVDNNIKWECISRRIEDERCPNTKVVAIMAGKVYAVDGDIVRFCSTGNPKDWTSADDAGFLPTGLQQSNANDMAVLAPYRANLAAFNATVFQNWQVDPDPASMAILDQIDGIGSTWPKAATAVGNELFFLAALGVRTVGIAVGSENLSAGDVGMPIDPLVQDAVRVALANGDVMHSTYYPSAGQYWLAVANYPPPDLALFGNLPNGSPGAPAVGTYTAVGGVLPYTFAVTSGAMPTGITLDPDDGSWSGTYPSSGSFSWTVTVTDADGATAHVDDTASVAALLWPGYGWTTYDDADASSSGQSKPVYAQDIATTVGLGGAFSIPPYTTTGGTNLFANATTLNGGDGDWSPTLDLFSVLRGSTDRLWSSATGQSYTVHTQPTNFAGEPAGCWAEDLAEFFWLFSSTDPDAAWVRSTTGTSITATGANTGTIPRDVKTVIRAPGRYFAFSHGSGTTATTRIMHGATGQNDWTAIGNIDTHWRDAKYCARLGKVVACGHKTGDAASRKVITIDPVNFAITDITPASMPAGWYPTGIDDCPPRGELVLIGLFDAAGTTSIFVSTTGLAGSFVEQTGVISRGLFGQLRWQGYPHDRFIAFRSGGAVGNGVVYSNTTL